jgi:N-6 DNA Methylase
VSRTRDLFAAVHSEGNLLPPDLLQRLMDRDKALPGLAPADYHHDGERLNELAAASWLRLQGRWLAFQDARAALPADDPGTTVTRERWLLPLFQELDYGRLQTAKAVELGGRSYAVSHAWPPAPIHLVGCNVALDQKTAGVAGAARTSPHSLVQELLNRSDDHLWAFVSNGLRLRMLRDNVSLSRQAYVELDLEAMMEGELYSDFVLLWLLCHQSRVEGERPEECWLERWSQEAQQQGVRALDGLRKGVERAISSLGSGFLRQAGNQELLEKLRDGRLDKQDYYRQLLRMVYRLLFLFTAEDRGLLLDPAASEAAVQTYTAYYSTERLRHLAERRRGSRHTDLFESLHLVMHRLGGDGCPELGLPPLGSMLFADDSVADVLGCRLANRDLLEAVRCLAFTEDGRSLRSIDFRNLGAEELGSVYESLLEMQPDLNREAATFKLRVVSGSERKTTGSYYTPSSLIQCLLDTALDPVVDERLKAAAPDDRERALLDLKVCDPACGSGHFLIAAAHRLARRLAAVRTGDDEPAPQATRQALRDVIGHCIYGVDINPMSVELCKVNLWMEALEPGKPLSFLDHRIQCGNSLLGATPALLREGIPDDAFKAIGGDDKKVCTELRKQNKKERAGQTSLFGRALEPWERLGALASGMMDLDDIDDATPEGVREKQARYERVVRSSDYLYGKLLADTWCAAFVWPKTRDATYQITEEVFRKIEENPHGVPVWLPEDVQRLAERYRFFHWHLQFPDVFRMPRSDLPAENELTGWNGGFDVVLGNPPWERVRIQEKEWFAAHGRDDIATLKNAAKRKKMIEALAEGEGSANRQLHANFKEDRRQAEGESQLLRVSGRYPLCGRGDVNTYAVFAELKRSLLTELGRVGCILPSGIATDDTTKFFFRDLMDSASVTSLYDFENRNMFPAVHSSFKFCLLSMAGPGWPTAADADFVFFAHSVSDLREDEYHFTLSASDIALLNPNTRTCPVFRSRRDAEITKSVYRRVPVFVWEGPPRENAWGIVLRRVFDMNQTHVLSMCQPFDATTDLRGWMPMWESKLMHQFDPRFATYEGGDTRGVLEAHKRDPSFSSSARWLVPEAEVRARFENGSERQWILGWRNICRNTDERTAIAAILPFVGTDFTLRVNVSARVNARAALLLVANLNSLAFDYCARQMLGGTNLSDYIMKQLPVLPPSRFEVAEAWTEDRTLGEWVARRSLELSHTTGSLSAFAAEAGFPQEPFVWDSKRRFQLRCELDAAFFHLYGLARDEVEYVMETFPIVRRRDEATYGEYQTKLAVLTGYDAMVAASECEDLARDEMPL